MSSKRFKRVILEEPEKAVVGVNKIIPLMRVKDIFIDCNPRIPNSVFIRKHMFVYTNGALTPIDRRRGIYGLKNATYLIELKDSLYLIVVSIYGNKQLCDKIERYP